MPTLLERLHLRRPGPQPFAEATRALSAADVAPEVQPDRSGYAWGVPPGGLDEVNAGVGAATQTDRRSLMQELYDGYIACPWAWACVQAIARTITAGGLVTEWDSDTDEANPVAPGKPANVLALDRLIGFVNPAQDIRQLIRNVVADLLVFADAYIEVVWWGGVPVALFNQDSPTTTPLADEHGAVSGYVQVTEYGKRAEFEPKQIIHISLDSARPGVFGVSPMQAAMGSVTAWIFAAATGKELFRKGLPSSFHADFPAATPKAEMRSWRDQYRTQNLGPKNIGTPVMTKGGVALKELQTGKAADVLAAKDQTRGEIFATFGVPPSKATVIESGNLGGGTGEDQDKTYRIDTCQPIAELVLEKLDYHLTRQAFHVEDWHLRFPDVDYRDSKTLEDIRDERLRNGSWTLNKYRADIGEGPVAGGNDAVLVDRQNIVLWADMDAMSKAMVASKAPRPPALPSAPPLPDAPDPAGTGDTAAGETAALIAAYARRLSAVPRRHVAGELTTVVAEARPPVQVRAELASQQEGNR